MAQKHLLQPLTLMAMEPPTVADSESLRNKKIEVLQAIAVGRQRKPKPTRSGDSTTPISTSWGPRPTLLDADLRRPSALHGKLAMEGRAVLSSNRQEHELGGNQPGTPIG